MTRRQRVSAVVRRPVLVVKLQCREVGQFNKRRIGGKIPEEASYTTSVA